jgi:hypothetical protein
MPAITFESPVPLPKSKILFQLREIDGEIQNQLQMDTASGRVSEGSVKNWLLLGVRNALKEFSPNGPVAWEVGEDAEATRFPVMPVTSCKSAPWLNG